MKLKTQETIRKIELGTYIGATAFASILTKNQIDGSLTELLKQISQMKLPSITKE